MTSSTRLIHISLVNMYLLNGCAQSWLPHQQDLGKDPLCLIKRLTGWFWGVNPRTSGYHAELTFHMLSSSFRRIMGGRIITCKFCSKIQVCDGWELIFTVSCLESSSTFSLCLMIHPTIWKDLFKNLVGKAFRIRSC